MAKKREYKNEEEYEDYFMEGDKGEDLYDEAKEECVKDPTKCIELLAFSKCEKQYPQSKNQQYFCNEGVKNAKFDDKKGK